jgi:glucose/mannose transport system substrate-binding protein
MLDACARASMRDLRSAEAAGRTVPTLAGSHAASSAVVGAVQDVVTRHFNTAMSSAEAVQALVAAIDAAR